MKNDKVKLENLVSEKENKINDFQNEIKEKEDNLNLKFVETKNDFKWIKYFKNKWEINY